MKENKNLEFKSAVTNSFLKTVSAYSNFGEGMILFGVNDDGSVCGIKNLQQTCLDIENRINDSILPKPDFEIETDDLQNIIRLIIHEGQYKPYLYKGKAYRRSDTASLEVDQAELKQLVLQGSNLYFEELACGREDLTFQELSNKLMEKMDISVVSEDILRTLGLFTKDRKFNNAAALLADENDFYGIDIARFGNSINEIMDRETISGTSVLKQYNSALAMVRRYYQYEEISEIERKKVDLIPENAYREAVANALIHRDWSMNSHIRISLFPDKIEIKSPGGLPRGITAEEYLSGRLSVLRNRNLANVFYRLGFVEIFGTGITRIKQLYEESLIKPEFEVSENAIKIMLPVFESNVNLTEDEKVIYTLLSKTMLKPISEIAPYAPFGKSKTTKLLKDMGEKGVITVEGKGRGTKYIINWK